MDEDLKKHSRAYRWDKVGALLPARDAADSGAAVEGYVRELIHSSLLCVFIDDANVRARRDQFAADLQLELNARGLTESAKRLGEATDKERLIEHGYIAIRESVEKLLRPHLSPIRHAWAAVVNAERHVYACRSAMMGYLKSVRSRYVKVDSALIPNAEGKPIDVDEQVSRCAECLASTLLMLGSENDWFEKNAAKQLVLPVHETVTSKDISFAVVDTMLANAYMLLRRGADAVRHFDGEVTEGEKVIPFTDGEKKVNTLAVIPSPGPIRVLYVAQQRLNHLLVQNYNDLMAKWRDHLKMRVKGLNATQLPNKEYVSDFECYSLMALSQLLYTPLLQHTSEYGGLTLIEWLRGYCALQELGRSLVDANESIDENSREAVEKFLVSCIVPFDDPSLKAVLTKVGLSERKAQLFIEAITFSRTHDDLLDAPLIRCADGRRYFLPRTASFINPTMVVLSQLNRLGVDLGWKGTTFEESFIRTLTQANLVAKGYDGEVEIDCILLWDDHLFVFECKNVALPGTAEAARYNFFRTQVHAVDQATEKLDWLKEHPEVIEKLFGKHQEIKQWIPVVVNGIPFCLNEMISACYITDASTITKFLEDPRLTQNVISESAGSQTMIRQVLKELYKGDPKPEDFVKVLSNSPQFAIADVVCSEMLYPLYLKDDYFLLFPVLHHEEVTLATMARALGLDVEALEEHQRQIRKKLDDRPK